MKSKGTRIAKIILKKTIVGRISLPEYYTYYIATVTKIIWYSVRNRNINQWTRMETHKLTHTYILN